MALTTDATPRIHLTPAQVLQDKHRMKRLKAALGNGIFSYADDNAADEIMTEILKICGGSAETISEVFQTKFFIDHTPFYWTLVNRHSKPGIPPLFERLLSACDKLTGCTQEDIMDALYFKYDSEVYAAVKDRLTDVPTHEVCNESFFGGSEDRLIVTAERHSSWRNSDTKFWNVHFRIPRFLNRLTVDEEVWFEFLAHGEVAVWLAVLSHPTDFTPFETLFRLTATLLEPNHQVTHSRWQFKMEEIRSRSSAFAIYWHKQCWEFGVHMPLTQAANRHSRLPINSVVFERANKYGIMSVELIAADLDPYWDINTLIASGRDVSGTLTIRPYQ